jgi:hypothetical protein
MKEIIITESRIRTELITLLACVIIACLFNAGAIIYYKSPVIEMITSLGYVLIFAVGLYILWTLIRLIIYGVKTVFSKK